jgi:hypothetical protein
MEVFNSDSSSELTPNQFGQTHRSHEEEVPVKCSGQGFEKFGGFYFECVCQRNDVYDRDIPFAPLDAAYVVAMEIR